jgi:hypothetical protein
MGNLKVSCDSSLGFAGYVTKTHSTIQCSRMLKYSILVILTGSTTYENSGLGKANI